jgi:hypothetical protein
MARMIADTGEGYKQIWNLAETIYYDMMINLYNMYNNCVQKKGENMDLLSDGDFHRAILCVACESARFVYNVFQILYRKKQCHSMMF